MYIERHSNVETPAELAEALEYMYLDSDCFTVAYVQDPPQEAERTFLYSLMQKQLECIFTAPAPCAAASDCIEILPGVFTNLKPVDGQIVSDIIPAIDYAVMPGAYGGSEIRILSNIAPRILRSIFPNAKTITKTVRSRYRAAGSPSKIWDCAAADLVEGK